MDLTVSAPGSLRQPTLTRWLARLIADLTAWAAGIAFAATIPDMPAGGTQAQFLALLAAAVVVYRVIAWLHTSYRGRPGLASFDEAGAVTVDVTTTILILTVVDIATPRLTVAPGTLAMGGLAALFCLLATRYLRRLRRECRIRRSARAATTPVLLFGAGDAARQLISSMLHDPHSRYAPVGMLDDDPTKLHLRIQGVPVLGNRAKLAQVMAATGADTVIFAVANPSTGLIGEVRRLAVRAGATFKVLPSVSELIDGQVGVADVRDVQITDVLGRHQINTDLASIAGYLTGKRVLVTGAGGSIGSELCRQIDQFAPGELMMLDRDESALHAVQLALRGRALLDSPEIILADLRDAAGIRAIFAERRPQVVFHAAALKHLPLLESHPGEAVQGNIWATLAVLEAATDVERFVNISTDKAANPTSVLGYSKRITERLTAHFAAQAAPGVFLNVRFGNVLGSRGSVLTAFQAQVAAGGPITVTHPEVTRYFMTVEEAVQLVIQAAGIGRAGEALVLEMGRPVRIAEVAQQLASSAPRPIEIIYTGLRPGEKMHEELFSTSEKDSRPIHPLISHVSVDPLDPAETRLLDPRANRADLIAELARLCVGSDHSMLVLPRARSLGAG